ncbi:MAG: DUF2959 domain-containing protein [Opitutaceae bacterium]|nr:DUF2959 domain-containing protein [Opitutaceae bacterium]
MPRSSRRPPPFTPFAAAFAVASGLLLFAGCQAAYFGALEKMGIPKREVLVDRVASARSSQEAAKEQFASALEKLLAITKVEPGEIKERYDLLNAELKRNEARAADVRHRLNGVRDVAEALFDEWNDELKQYSSAELRNRSAAQLEKTQRNYRDLMIVMERAAARMEPVLNAFRDQVLFLKHNLNAQAVRSLDTTSQTLQEDIGKLIADMENSIREADEFIQTLKPAG